MKKFWILLGAVFLISGLSYADFIVLHSGAVIVNIKIDKDNTTEDYIFFYQGPSRTQYLMPASLFSTMAKIRPEEGEVIDISKADIRQKYKIEYVLGDEAKLASEFEDDPNQFHEQQDSDVEGEIHQASSSNNSTRYGIRSRARVMAMADANLAINDRSTELSVFNHHNFSGIMFEPRESYMEIGISGWNNKAFDILPLYDNWNNSVNIYSRQVEGTGFLLGHPQGQDSEIILWLNDRLVLKVEPQADMFRIHPRYEDYEFYNYILGAKVGMAYQSKVGLAWGGELGYSRLFGKNDLYGGDSAIGLKAEGANVAWSLSTSYQSNVINHLNTLTMGFSIGSDQEKPRPASLASGYDDGEEPFGDYGLTFQEDTWWTHESNEFVIKPFKTSAELIWDWNKSITAGILFDYKTRQIDRKSEFIMDYSKAWAYSLSGIVIEKNDIPGYRKTNEYKLMPGIKAMVDINESTTLLAGISYSLRDELSVQQIISSDGNFNKSISTSPLQIGLGGEFWNRKINVALQYEWAQVAYHEIYNDPSYNYYQWDASAKYTAKTIKAGIEIWLIPMLAIRGGYALYVKDYPFDMNNDGYNYKKQDLQNQINLGAGIYLGKAFSVELLFRHDQYIRKIEELQPLSYNISNDPFNTIDAYAGVKLIF